MKTNNSIEFYRSKLNEQIILEKNVKSNLYTIKLEKKDLRKKGKKNKVERQRFKKLKDDYNKLIATLDRCLKEKIKLRKIIRNANRKKCKNESPERNNLVRRINKYNNKKNSIMNIEKIKKQIQKRKTECKIKKKERPLKRLIKIKKGKHKHINNKPKFKSFNGFIKYLENTINGIIKEVNDECLTYNSQLDFYDILYVISKKMSNNTSISLVNQHLKNKNISNVHVSAINKKRQNIDSKYVELVHTKLMKILIPEIEKCSEKILIEDGLYAVDGTIMNLLKSLSNDGLKLNDYGTYCSLIYSCIFDLSNEVPIDIHMDGSKNESKLFIDKINILPKNSIIMGDGKYFNKNIIRNINDNNIYGIFKVSRNLKICKDLLASDDDQLICDYDGHQIRLIKLKCGNETYILGTNLLDENKYDNKTIIELFKQRWYIEEYFKTLKCTLNLNKTKSQNKNNVLQEVYMQMIIVTISKYIEIMAPNYVLNKNMYKNQKINRTKLIKNIANDFLYYIFYKKLTKKYLNKIYNLLFDLINDTILIEDNRFELRKRKLPITEYQNNGNHDNG